MALEPFRRENGYVVQCGSSNVKSRLSCSNRWSYMWTIGIARAHADSPHEAMIDFVNVAMESFDKLLCRPLFDRNNDNS